MNKTTLLLLLLLSAFAALPGCSDDRRPVNILSLPSNIAIDQAEGGNRSFMIIRPLFESTRTADVHVESAEAHDFGQAIEAMQRRSSKRIVLGKVQTVFFGKDLAMEGINDLLRQFDDITDFDVKAKLAVVDGRASDVGKLTLPEDARTGFYLADILELGHRKQFVPSSTFSDVMRTLASLESELVLPIVHINTNQHEIFLGGLAVFRKGQMVGDLSAAETSFFMVLTGEASRLPLNITDEASQAAGYRHLSAIVRNVRKKITVSRSGSRPAIDVELKLRLDIVNAVPEDTSNTILYNKKPLEKEETERLRVLFDQYLTENISRLVQRAQQEFRSDIFNFGKEIRIHQYVYFKSVDWSQEFPAAKVRIKVKTEIRQFEGMSII